MDILRTPDACFVNLPDYPFVPNYLMLSSKDRGELRMHYVDEGPRDAPAVLMLHGEPTWSFLYRKMIPIFNKAGYRTIAPDYIGFGRSDKLSKKTAYSFQQHVDWLYEFVTELDLRRIVLVCQDWGGPLGMAVLARAPERFAAAIAANTMLHTVDSELAGQLEWANHAVDEGRVTVEGMLLAWMLHSQRATDFRASDAVLGSTVRPVSEAVLAAYDAPFPDESFKAGIRQFPILIPVTPEDPGAQINRLTWDALASFSGPFLTLFSDSDPSTQGWGEIFRERIASATGQPHAVIENAGHFLQGGCWRSIRATRN